MGKGIIILILLVLLSTVVIAQNFRFIYNPFTAKLDRSLKLNQSGFNQTSDFLFGANVSNTTGYLCSNLVFDDGSIGASAICDGADAAGTVSAGNALNVTNLNASGRFQINVTSCSQALETNADGVIFCGVDETAAGGDDTTLGVDNNWIVNISNEITINGSTFNDSVGIVIDNGTINRSIGLEDYLLKVGDINSTAWNKTDGLIVQANLGDLVGINTSTPSHGLTVNTDILFNLTADQHFEIDAFTRTQDSDPLDFRLKPAIESINLIHSSIDLNSFPNTRWASIDMDLNGLAEEEHTDLILATFDTTDADGGDAHGLTIVKVGLNPENVHIHAISVEPGVNPVLQESGSFINITEAFINSTTFDFRNATTNFSLTTNDATIFENDNDYVFIGHAERFSDIEFLFNRTSSGPGIKPIFEHSNGSIWHTFSPSDGTDGMRENGLIAFEPDDLGNWSLGTVNRIEAFWIRIQRTTNTITVPPIEKRVQIAIATVFFWNESGDISINDLIAAGDITQAGNRVNDSIILNTEVPLYELNPSNGTIDHDNLLNFDQAEHFPTTSLFHIANYSAEYEASGFDNENASIRFGVDYANEGFKIANGTLLPFSAFDKENVTADLLNNTEDMQDACGAAFGAGLVYDDAGDSMLVSFDLSSASNESSAFKIANVTADVLNTTEDFQDGALGVIGDGTQTGITVIYQDGTNDVDFILDFDLSTIQNESSAFKIANGTDLPFSNFNIGNGTDLPFSAFTIGNYSSELSTNLSNFDVVGRNTSNMNITMVNFNSTCGGFRFNNSVDAGGLFSCL